MTYTIDYFYQLNHRRLRERFSMETIERHEPRLADALKKRHAVGLAKTRVMDGAETRGLRFQAARHSPTA